MGEEIKTILDQETEDEQMEQFEAILVIAKGVKKEKKRVEKERKKKLEAEKEKKAGKPWNEEEMALLANAMGRFPGGTMQRWEKIQKVVGRHRSVDEIIAKVKELAKKGRNKKKKKGGSANATPKKE